MGLVPCYKKRHNEMICLHPVRTGQDSGICESGREASPEPGEAGALISSSPQDCGGQVVAGSPPRQHPATAAWAETESTACNCQSWSRAGFASLANCV